jgi:hypothetical protein
MDSNQRDELRGHQLSVAGGQDGPRLFGPGEHGQDGRPFSPQDRDQVLGRSGPPDGRRYGHGVSPAVLSRPGRPALTDAAAEG